VKKAHVLHLTDGDEFGGGEQAILTLLKQTDRSRWDLTLAYHPTDALAPLVDGARAAGATPWAIPRMDPGFEGLGRLPAFARELRRRAPDIVHLHLMWPLACQYQLLAAAMYHHAKVVATAHSYVDLRLSWRVDHQQRLYTRAVDRYLAVSQHVRTKLVDGLGWPPEKIDVVHNGVDADAYREPADIRVRTELTNGRPGTVVLLVARLDPQKGHRHLLAAAAELPDVRVAFAGEGPERRRLEAAAVELGIDDRVAFLGHRTDVARVLAASDIVALPSAFEGLPVSLLEAMAAGKPVVASNIGGVDELVQDDVTGVLFEPGNARALAAAVRRLIDDPGRAGRLAAAGHARVIAEFSSSAMARRVGAVYERVLSD
jgi:glycosyltransferase involved in cell wall biosynthesis